MGIKLVKTITIISFFISGCNSTKYLLKDDFFVAEENFVKAYKTAFACGCINEATKEGLNKFFVDNKDPGLFSDIETISYFKVKEADSVGRSYAKKISRIEYEDAGYSKPIFSSCFQFSLGEDIDQIAKESYRKK